MPAGTIALSNNSKTVTGTGTSFTTELKPGDFVYVTVGGAPYTLVASSVTSDTQLTLAIAFDGPNTSGLAWNAVPASLQVAITQKILNDFASVARGRILDFQNWQRIYSNDESVTVTRPDRTQFTGPSWGYMATQFAGKANTDDVLTKADNLKSLADVPTARTNLGFVDGALPLTLGGTGAKTKDDAWKALATYGTTSGTAAQGNDTRLDTVDAKTGGTIKSPVVIENANGGAAFPTELRRTQFVNGTYFGGGFILGYTPGNNYLADTCDFYMQYDGTIKSVFHRHILPNGAVQGVFAWHSNGNYNAYNGSFVNGSDERIKENIERISNPLEKMRLIKGVTYILKSTGMAGIGFIAQDVEQVFPEAVTTSGYDQPLPDGSIVKEVKSIDAGSIAAGLHHEAILALMDKIEQQDAVIAELQNRMKDIDGLDA